MSNSPDRLTWRKVRASWRDTLLLLREFQQPLFFFALAIIGSGSIYYQLSRQTAQPVRSLPEAIYIVLSLTFLQANLDFPDQWSLQIFFFLMPIIGMGILAQGLADFGILLFNRRLRGKEWEMAVASTYNNHVILIGLGHLGYRVVKQLNDLEQEVVVIELAPKPDLLSSVQRMGVPVLQDDGTREAVMVAAGVPKARVIILCTQDDSLNLQMALKARNLNPNIKVVIRIFDDEFATSLQTQFGFHALSATGMAAPLFAGMAANVEITAPITIEGEPHILAHVQISTRSRLNGVTILSLEERFRVSVVLQTQDGRKELHPPGENIICPGQTLAIFGQPEHITLLMHENVR